MGVVRYEWRGHAVWLSHKLLMEMEVATLYYFVGGNNIQTGAVGDSEASFFPNVKDSNFVASPFLYTASYSCMDLLVGMGQFIHCPKFPATACI